MNEDETTHVASVRKKARFLHRVMVELAGDSIISLTGDLSSCSFADSLIAPRTELEHEPRESHVSCLDSVALRLKPEAVEPIFAEIMRAGLKRRVVHITVVRDGVQQFGAFDNFHPDCVSLGPRFTTPLLEELKREQLIHSFDPPRDAHAW